MVAYGHTPITVTGLPPQSFAFTSLAAIALIAGDVDAGNVGGDTLQPVAGVSTVHVAWPPPLTRAELTMWFRHASSHSEQTLQVWTDVAAALTLSSGDLLPFITAPATVDLTTRTVSWSQNSGAQPDGIHIELSYPHGLWYMLVPPGTTQYAFPNMPADVADVLPPTTGFGAADVYLLEHDTIPSYHALRELPEIARMEASHEYGASRVRVARSPF